MYQTLDAVGPMFASLFSVPIGLGYWGADNFANDITRYASDQGVNLTGSWMKKYTGNYDYYMGNLIPNDLSVAVDFIEAGLNMDSPVAMLIYGNRAAKNMKPGESFQHHWVTITEIALDSNKEYQIVVSSWGIRYELNLNELWNDGGEIGLACFQ